MRKLPKKSTSLEGSQIKSPPPEDNIKVFEKYCMTKKDAFPCLLCKMMFTSKLTLRVNNSNEHTRRNSLNVDILAIERFDQLDPCVQLLSGLNYEDKASQKGWFESLKTSIRESDAMENEGGTQKSKNYKQSYIVSTHQLPYE